MDPEQLVRWTRFAAKGGIGKCTAVNDYIAQQSNDLMFLKGDEIVVLWRIPDEEDVYLGLCEGIIGRFRGQDVQFHGKLKRPIITKRSSVSTGKYPSSNSGQSIPPPSRADPLKAQDDNSSAPPPSITFITSPPRTLSFPSTENEGLSSPLLSFSASTTPSESFVATPFKSYDRATRRSLGSDSGRSVESSQTSSPPRHSPYIVVDSSPLDSARIVSPLNIVKKSPTASPLYQTTFTQEEQSLDTQPSPIPLDTPATSSFQSPPPTGSHDSDGETGIGLSFLQSLGSAESDDDESFSEHTSIRHDEHDDRDDESTVEGLLYDDLIDDNLPHPPTLTSYPSVKQDDSPSHEDLSQTVVLPSRSSSPRSPTSPHSLGSLSPPANYQHFSISSPKPSLRSQQSHQSLSSWEGAGDIYDDYRYSRASVLSGGTMITRGRRSSAASCKASQRDAWDGNGNEPPPPPIPAVGHRPSNDSLFASRSSNGTPLRRSVESKKSSETRKSDGSRKSSDGQLCSEIRRSRQELLFPQPPSTVNVQHELLDQATRENLRRTSEATRILTPADFRLSVESEASIYSRLSVIEQEPQEPQSTTESDTSSLPRTSPGSPVQTMTEMSSNTHLRLTPLQLPQSPMPLLHTNWATPTSSTFDPGFSPTSGTSPMTPMLIPAALMSLTTGAASALRERVETTKRSEEPDLEKELEQDSGLDGGEGEKSTETLRDIVVADEEGIPLGAMQETTFETGYTRDTTLDITQTSIVLSQSVQPVVRGDIPVRTPSPTSPLENRDIPLPNPFGLPSPILPSQPPEAQSLLGGRDVAEPLSPTTPTSPDSPMLPTSPTLSSQPSHLRPPRQPPTLADLREGGGTPIPGTNQRRSLFLPHPNAPKAPPTGTQGPMFIAARRHSLPPADISDFVAPEIQVTLMPKKSLFEIMHGAVHFPPPAMRPRMMSRGPTIYGQCDVELGASLGPVPITFSIEPPPPPPSQNPAQQHMTPQLSGGQVPVSSASPTPPVQPGVVPPSPRSAMSSPVFGVSASRSEAIVGSLEVSRDAILDANGSEVIPRANFFPKSPGQRPRSRSFSAFNSHSTKVEMPMPISREGGTVQLVGQPSANDVRQSLKNGQRSSIRSSISQSQLKISSPLHLSPLSIGISTKQAPSKPPSSPLSQSFRPSSVSGLRQQLSPSPTPSIGLQPPPPSLLRQATSRSTLNDSLLLLRSTVVVSDNLESPSSFTGPSLLPEYTNHEQTMNEAVSISISNQNDNHSNSHFAPPSPAHHHHPSLRSKLSLPNLRRHRSKNDDIPSPTVPEHDLSHTVQVQDLDFELVRPAIQLHQARSSEDSAVLVGRDNASMDISQSREVLFQRATSPARLYNGPRSPTSEGFGGLRPRPSLPAMATPTIMRPGADTGHNMEAHRHRELKWMSLMNSLAASQWRKSKKVKKLVYEGVPSSVRYLIWQHLTDGQAKVVPGVYSQLGKRERIAAADMIEEDIRTCFRDQPHLQRKGGPVLALLQSYLTMVPDVQYTRGLTLIAGQILLHAPEEDAFWIFVSIMDSHLRPYFSTTTIQMDVDASLFNRVVEQNDIKLAKKLYTDLGIEQSTVCAVWFSTLFVSTLPPDYVNRIWDVFLCEGVPFLLRVGAAIINCCRRHIIGATSPDAVLEYLHHPSPAWLPSTPDAFLSLAHSVKMKDDDIRKSRIKMEAQVKKLAQAQTPRHLPINSTISLPRP